VSRKPGAIHTTEHGNPIDEQLAEMKAIREKTEAHLIDVFWQQRNFAFAGTLEPQELTFEEL